MNQTATSAGATAAIASNLQPESLVTSKARDAAHDIVDNVAQSAASAERNLREAASRNEAALRQTAAKAKGKGEEMSQQVERYVREHPIASAGIAFVAGLFASKMLSK